VAVAQFASSFAVASDGVDPALVPTRTLATGAKIPAIGLGTFGSDRYTGDDVARAVVDAASVGYRHFDCASVYGNEDMIGPALGAIIAGGVSRDDLWVTSKVWNDKHDQVAQSCEQSLRDLGLDYLDL
jgi:alcohol dehydrogenase (NADP+)